MTEIKISEDMAIAIFRDAFLTAIPKEERDKIFAKAVGDLLKQAKESRGFYGSTSWLAQEMVDASRRIMGEMVRSYINEPANRAVIENAVKACIDPIMAQVPTLVEAAIKKTLEDAVEIVSRGRRD